MASHLRFRLRDAKKEKKKWFILDQCCQHNKMMLLGFLKEEKKNQCQAFIFEIQSPKVNAHEKLGPGFRF